MTAVDEPAPKVFARAVASVRAWQPPAHIQIYEIPAPRRIAPHAFALAAVVNRDEETIAHARLILLHDPGRPDSWHGPLRLVTYLSVPLPPVRMVRPERTDVIWTWFTDALTRTGARFTAAGGTVTGTYSTKCGDLRESSPLWTNLHQHDRDSSAAVELRASWTPLTNDLTTHLRGWSHLLTATARLTPDSAVDA